MTQRLPIERINFCEGRHRRRKRSAVNVLAILSLAMQQPRTRLPGVSTPAPPVDAPIYSYVPMALFFAASIALPFVLLLVSRMLHRKKYEVDKMQPYECGVDPIGGAHERFSVRYYIIAMLFLVFDVETIFLIPWAVIYDKLALFGLIEMLVFIGILVVGYYYAWRKGALEWV